jgi:uncharacterized protein
VKLGFFVYIICILLTAMQKRVKVKPNSRSPKIVEEEDGSLTVHLKSPPVDGKANEELVKVLADKYDVKKSSITIKSGLTSRQKLVEIEN